MSYIGKCYRLLEDDEEIMMQWPEIKTGFEFQVLRVDGVGATRIRCLNTNKIFDIEYPLEARNPDYDDTHSWFWCVMHLIDYDLEELESVDLPEEKPTSIGKIKMNHFQGREVDIAYALVALASQENCDGEEYDLMIAAADYIRRLETKSPMAFAEAVIEGKLDDWAADSFNDSSRDETRNTDYIIRSGVEQFLKI